MYFNPSNWLYLYCKFGWMIHLEDCSDNIINMVKYDKTLTASLKE